MMSQKWYWWKKRVFVVAGLLLSVSCVPFCSLGVLDPLNRAFADDEAQAGDGATNNAELAREQREKRLAEMRRRAEATKVYVLEDGERKAVGILPHPLMRWHDMVHRPRIVDATVWAWGTSGRPLATETVSLYEKGGGLGCWYALQSLSDGLIEVEFPDARPWPSKKPGIQWQTLPGAPEPADGKARRMFQLKEMARRFSATTRARTLAREELSFLPRPIHRYSDPQSGLLDGAIFVFSSHGLNTELLLVLELRTQAASESVWKYGPVRNSTFGLSLRLDGREVWSVRQDHRYHRWDTWVHFLSSDPVRF